VAQPLHPLQGALAPGVDEATHQNHEEQEHLHQGKETELAVGHGPGVKKNGLHVEDEEDQGVDVVLDPEAYPRLADGFETAFIDGFLDGGWLPGAERNMAMRGKTAATTSSSPMNA
jgi:hypothetical protein